MESQNLQQENLLLTEVIAGLQAQLANAQEQIGRLQQQCKKAQQPQQQKQMKELKEVIQVEETKEEVVESPKKLSKKQLKKEKKKLEKKLKREKREREEREAAELAQREAEKNDPLKNNYGDNPMVQSQNQSGQEWISLKEINKNQGEYINKVVLVRGRIHTMKKQGAKLVFLTLREQFATLQVIVTFDNNQTVSLAMIGYVKTLPNESIVDIRGKLVKPQVPVKSCSIKLEMQILTCYCVDKSLPTLPFQLKDASRPLQKGESEGLGEDNKERGGGKYKVKNLSKNKKKSPIVTLNTRLNNRVIDMRTPANQATYRLSSAIGQLFREYLYSQDFVEIHSPKLIGGVSEGGTEVFRLDYFGKEACLAQSPQLYKQMAIMGDLGRVFEIGPVFRAENSFTNRHMCEFVGMDIEMAIKEHYFEVLQVIGDLFYHIFKGLQQRFGHLLKIINEQYPFEPFELSEEVTWITYEEGVGWLNEQGFVTKQKGEKQDVHKDLSTEAEKALGKIVKDKFHTDFYILHRYPIEARPFYTMLCADDPQWTCSYDVFMRGEEITSGAQRVHDTKMLTRRAQECHIPLPSLKDYIESFSYGAFPHGGCGIGLERVVMLYADLKNIRKTSMFPRTPDRLFP